MFKAPPLMSQEEQIRNIGHNKTVFLREALRRCIETMTGLRVSTAVTQARRALESCDGD